MTQAMSAARAACPRCRSATVEPLCDSPVAGVWTLYRCKTCLYAWRSTEPEENTNPDKYPALSDCSEHSSTAEEMSTQLVRYHRRLQHVGRASIAAPKKKNYPAAGDGFWRLIDFGIRNKTCHSRL